MSGYYLAGLPPVSRETVLRDVSSILCSVGEAQPASKRKREAGLWETPVRGVRPLVELIRAYAAANEVLTLAANGVNLGSVRLDETPPRVISSDLLLTTRYSLFGNEEQTKELLLPIPDARTRAIVTGQWVDLGNARIRLGSLIPVASMDGDTAVLRWTDPPQVELGSHGFFGLIRRVTRTTLRELRIGPNYGDFVTSGVVGWVLPRLRWE